jgi:hypothetical protein
VEIIVAVGVAEAVEVSVGVKVGGSVAVGVAVACRVPVGEMVGVTVAAAVGESVGNAVGVSVWVAEDVADAVAVGTDERGAPARIQARMCSMEAGESAAAPSGMRPPSPAAGLVSLIIKKLWSGLPGTTRRSPADLATGFVDDTFTRASYECIASSTRFDCAPRSVALWQPAPRQLTLKMSRWMAPKSAPEPSDELPPPAGDPFPAHALRATRQISVSEARVHNGQARLTALSPRQLRCW